MMLSRRRSGFTVLEVLIVMAILISVAALSYPSISAMYGNIRQTAAVDMIRGAWAEARAQAIEDGVAYRFALSQDLTQYRLAPDRSEFWEGGSGSSSEIEGALVREEAFPPTVTAQPTSLASEGFSSDWSTLLSFLPDGSCSADVEVIVLAEDCRPIQLRVRALTGHVTLTTLPRGNP